MADPSKTEEATPRRRAELRRKGQVAKSQELNAAILFAVAILFLRFYIPYVADFVAELSREIWTAPLQEMDLSAFMDLMRQLAFGFLLTFIPFFIVLVLTALAVNVAQVGLKMSLYPLRPDFNKVNPVSGFKRLFSLQPLLQLAQSLVKIAAMVLLAWLILRSHYAALLQTVSMELGHTGRLLGAIVWEIVWKLGLLLLVVAAVDTAWQRWYFSRNIRMSKQELKDEHKNTEGDPQIKARLRQLQRKAAMNRMMEDLPRADVVLTNPVHLAVAIAYDRERMNAPTVLAKGASQVAERIKARAREHEIPVIENKPLARALFRATEVGQEIPAELYAAVSEVLIYIYQLNGQLETYLDD